MAFDHRPTIATGTGSRPLVRRSRAVPTRFMENIADLLSTRVGPTGRDRLGQAHAQHATRMQGLTEDGIVETEITRHRVPGPLGACLAALDGLLAFVQEGQPRACITRMALGRAGGQEKTGGGC